MFERFKRSSKTQQYNENDYNQGAGFQSGDGYAGGAATGPDDGYATNSRAGDGTERAAVAADGRDTRTGVVDDGRDTRTGALDDPRDARTGVVDDGRDARTGAVDDPRDTRTGAVGQPTRRGAAPAAATTGATAPATAAEARAIQRERWGGADGTAIFFGWLSALGLAALLLAIVAAAGTSLGFANDVSQQDATNNASTIGIVGAAILVVILLLAYYCGGYVAGRMARFDGGRQGFRVWLLGLIVTIAAAVAGWIGGEKYNVFHQLNLPRIPVDEGDITTGAIITLAVVLIGTLLAAMAGGKAGDRYHRRVDATAWDGDRV
jgi:hypothetical protein